MMESSNLTESDLYHLDQSGLDLYYGQYSYRLSVRFTCVERTRYCTTIEKFHKFLSYKPEPWIRGKKNTISEIIKNDGGNINHLEDFIIWRSLQEPSAVKILLTKNWVTIYFNDTAVADGFLGKFPYVTRVKRNYRVKSASYQKDVIYRVNPKFKWRLFFSAGNLTPDDVDEMAILFNDHGMQPCRTLQRMLRRINSIYGTRSYIYDGNFVDFNDEGLTTIFALKWPRFIKKICRIEQR